MFDLLATVVGLVALVIAAYTYRGNVRIKREEQARLVYSKITHREYHDCGAKFPLKPNDARFTNGSLGVQIRVNRDPLAEHKELGIAIQPLIQVTAVIHNGSKELIGPARVQIVDVGKGKVMDEFSMRAHAVDPESDWIVDFTWINEIHPNQPSLETTLIFRDASGRWWRRHRSEPIERVHDDPENQGPTATECRPSTKSPNPSSRRGCGGIDTGGSARANRPFPNSLHHNNTRHR
jgi:hypothetical protein